MIAPRNKRVQDESTTLDTQGVKQQIRDLDYDTTAVETIARSGISLRGVTKRYGTATVVEDIDLEIEAGEFMTFLGPSGSGKTTTLNMIAGFTDVTEGDLFIHGKPVAKLPAHKRDLGVVFQNYALFPHMTVAENVAYPLKRRKVNKSEQADRVKTTLDMVKLGDYGRRFPSELSGGQQQRVALARALVYRPKVLLMDEPLGALDKKLREWLQIEIKRIHHEVGSTFVFVTHDQEEALSMSDRIAVFNEGKIEQVGTGVELYEHPETLFVGRFLGESTVITGESSATSNDGTELVHEGHRIVVPGQISASKQVILVRPENLSLEPTADSAVAPGVSRNALPVQVYAATYLGIGWRYDVTLPNGDRGVVRSAHSASRFGVGESALMTWRPENGVLLEDLPQS
ncbi:ABC transporter ATP-binding protein [Gulosibacter molinativorax]|uniref:Spermidine/putrescine import ATP-binding protein PotA n=1 Tax=Gulosibacter molinativorax TaxID=256821 RepID=A0ABT7C691_9MICO|nr:ABC transporter ATP-binding protein [Gulosibacter molinativorax]MDJ1370700.1 ABC transporter ATP-binding protein [Gulosibacter molinativorax]QUY63274.1 Spermidine/putrescine import ATP-binding protein PotA [Gulosibacter molinativorax]